MRAKCSKCRSRETCFRSIYLTTHKKLLWDPSPHQTLGHPGSIPKLRLKTPERPSCLRPSTLTSTDIALATTPSTPQRARPRKNNCLLPETNSSLVKNRSHLTHLIISSYTEIRGGEGGLRIQGSFQPLKKRVRMMTSLIRATSNV